MRIPNNKNVSTDTDINLKIPRIVEMVGFQGFFFLYNNTEYTKPVSIQRRINHGEVSNKIFSIPGDLL